MLAFMGLLLCGLVHRNARMTEMKRSGIEVVPAFADNVPRSFSYIPQITLEVLRSVCE